MRDLATVEGDGAIDGPTAVAARRQMDIDELGLDTLAANLGEESVTLEEVC